VVFDLPSSPHSPFAPPQTASPRRNCIVCPRWNEVNGAAVLTCPPERLDLDCYNPRPADGESALFLMKTYTAKPGEIEREWFLVDAEGKTLGRLATHIADTLRGKGKPVYTPHVDTGDFVVVVNAEKIAVTGSKLDTKIYYRHSGYPGGIKQRTLREQLERRPTEVIRKAVKGMLPKNKLASAQITKLKIYAGPEHPHAAQSPKPLEFA
jgi:large subunit ribosomal protein L13